MKALLHLFQHRYRRVRVRARRSPRVPPLVESGLNNMLCSSSQYCPWMERHWCSNWVAVEVTVAGVSWSHMESAPQAGSSVCTPTKQVAMAATKPLGGTERLSFEPVLLAVSFFGLARSNFCLSGRLSSEPAELTDALYWVLWDDPLPLLLFLPL